MSDSQPTEPLPPHEQPAATPNAQAPSYGQTPPYDPRRPAVPGEPFYKRHGLAFAISTLVLSVVVLLGLVTAGTFAVARVVTHVGDRSISRMMPDDGGPMMPGRPDDGTGNGNGNGSGDGNGNGGGQSQGRVLVRGTIASLSGDSWTIDRSGGAAVKVKVDASTVFGTPGQSVSASDFAKGDEVIVIGTRSNGTLTASRILKLDAFPTRPPSTPGPSTPGS